MEVVERRPRWANEGGGCSMKTLYTAPVTASGGRNGGHAKSSDGVLDLGLSRPKEMGGEGETGTNPEQLFAAGSSAASSRPCA
jgi:organic hydroperoxide reductase OsmC/OhrA